MNTDLLKKIEEKYYQKARDKFSTGDSVRVHTKIEEGDKVRTQIFAGVVIAVKGGGLSQTFTVRKISSGVGVEKIFPTHSPAIEKVELVRKGKNRRSKIYFLRNKVGNRALFVEEGGAVTEDDVYMPEDVTEAMEVVAEVVAEEIKAEEAAAKLPKAKKEDEGKSKEKAAPAEEAKA